MKFAAREVPTRIDPAALLPPDRNPGWDDALWNAICDLDDGNNVVWVRRESAVPALVLMAFVTGGVRDRREATFAHRVVKAAFRQKLPCSVEVWYMHDTWDGFTAENCRPLYRWAMSGAGFDSVGPVIVREYPATCGHWAGSHSKHKRMCYRCASAINSAKARAARWPAPDPARGL